MRIVETPRYPVPPPPARPAGTLRWTLAYLPIATNNLYPTRVLPGGKLIRYLDSRAKKWKQQTEATVVLSNVAAPEGDLGLTLILYPPDARKRDADGTIKLAQDAICAALGVDDSRIVHLDVWRFPPDRTDPRIEARLSRVLGMPEPKE